MEENSDIFLAGGDALVYFARPVHKKFSTTFGWGHPFSTYVSLNQFFNYFYDFLRTWFYQFDTLLSHFDFACFP